MKLAFLENRLLMIFTNKYRRVYCKMMCRFISLKQLDKDITANY